MFTTPSDLKRQLTARIRDELLRTAYAQAQYVHQFVGGPCHRREIGPLVAAQFHGHGLGAVLVSADINFRAIHASLSDSVKKATDLLEDRISRNIGEGEVITDVDLTIQQADLITGTVSGDGFRVDVRMLWNYRYGENSANGVLTVYPQFRGTRYGRPLPGKPQQSTATAAKEAAKAERLAAKAARRAELRAKFAKAPERLARECERDISTWGADHPSAPMWAHIRDAARALTVERLDAMFAAGARTSGDIEAKLERVYRVAHRTAV